MLVKGVSQDSPGDAGAHDLHLLVRSRREITPGF